MRALYWIMPTMQKFGRLGLFSALGILILFCTAYMGLYFGPFGLIVSLLAGRDQYSRRALLLAPAAWVAGRNCCGPAFRVFPGGC